MSNVRGEWCEARGATDRRAFLQTMTGVAISACLPNALRTAPHARRLDRIGVQLYTVRDEMKKDVAATLAKVAQIGYNDVEFAGYFDKKPLEIKALLDANGLKAPSSHISIEPDPWKAALAAAPVVGHQYLVLAWIPEEQRRTLDDWKRAADRLNKAGADAKAAGVQFAYHNHDFEFKPIDGRIPYDILLSSTDPKLVQLEIDLYWITRGGQDPLAYFAKWPGRIPMVHVKDSMGAPEHKMTDVGHGTIAWPRIFAREDQAGIKYAFVEHDQPADPFASIKASYDYLKAMEF